MNKTSDTHSLIPPTLFNELVDRLSTLESFQRSNVVYDRSFQTYEAAVKELQMYLQRFSRTELLILGMYDGR